tara:strand:+ start:977 stop:1381 length:405 start_codon:yes stop_codon:yes gene_type:complete
MFVNVLLYESGTEAEGIHSLEINGQTVVLMFENEDDAQRYCGLLEAQDFPLPTVEKLSREDVEKFCLDSEYDCKFIESGFVPSNDEERLYLVPPESNRDVSNWDKENYSNVNIDNNIISKEDVDDMRKKLEDLF